MERKRKLPARASARVDHASKKRNSSPPERLSQTPAPPPAAVEEPPPPPPPQQLLPRSVQPGKPLPTVEDAQSEDLPANEYQSLQERCVALPCPPHSCLIGSPAVHRAVLRAQATRLTPIDNAAASSQSPSKDRARNGSARAFEKYWTKPSRKKGVVSEDPTTLPRTRWSSFGQVTVTIEPRVFDATIYAVKDPSPRCLPRMPPSDPSSSMARPMAPCRLPQRPRQLPRRPCRLRCRLARKHRLLRPPKQHNCRHSSCRRTSLCLTSLRPRLSLLRKACNGPRRLLLRHPCWPILRGLRDLPCPCPWRAARRHSSLSDHHPCRPPCRTTSPHSQWAPRAQRCRPADPRTPRRPPIRRQPCRLVLRPRHLRRPAERRQLVDLLLQQAQTPSSSLSPRGLPRIRISAT